MKKPSSNPAGFTLIELLVVIAVIAVLSVLLLPALAATRGDVDKAYCRNSLRQIGLASQLYVKDNADRFADAWDFGYALSHFYGAAHLPAGGSVPDKYFQDYFYPYLGTNINEPIVRPTTLNPPVGANYKPQRGIFTCPGTLRTGGIDLASEDSPYNSGQCYGNRGVSYIWNYRYWVYPAGNVQAGTLSTNVVSNRKIGAVVDASKAVLLFDSPYNEARYMPHGLGINVLHADGSVGYARQNPVGEIWQNGRQSWWRYHSKYGWEN